MKTKRLGFLDMAKGIGIILVILGHIVYTEEHIRVWISSFHMPLFFVISGVLMAIKKEDVSNIRLSLKKRYRGLIIPYLWFSLLYFFLDVGNLLLNKIDSHTFLVNLISSLTFYGKSVLWFLTALFLGAMYFILLRNKLKDYQVIIGIVIIVVLSYFCKNGLELIYGHNADNLLVTSLVNFARTFVRAGIILPFIGLGYYIWKLATDKIPAFVENEDSRLKLIQLGTGIFLLVVNIIISMINWSVDTNNMILGNVFLYYLGGLTGSFALILICQSLPELKLISYLGRNSLIIMAVHMDCYILWAGIRLGMVVYGFTNLLPVLVIVAVIVVLILCCIPIEIINRFLPFVLGKSRKGIKR